MENKEITMQERLEALKNNRFHVHRKEIGDHAERHTEDKSDDMDWYDGAKSYASLNGWTGCDAEFETWVEYVNLLFRQGTNTVNDYFNGK